MTPAQVLDTVRAQVYETAEGFWTDDEIYAYMWQCEQDIAAEIECTESTDSSTTTVASTNNYTKPTGCLIICRLEWNSVKLKKVDKTDVDAMEGTSYGGTISESNPHSYYEWDDEVYLYPTPNAAQTLKYWYIADPAQITSSSTAFTVDRHFHTTIPDYCLWRMYAKDQDDGRAEFFRREYADKFKRAKMKWARRNVADWHQVVRDEEYYPQTELGLI